MLTHPPEHQGQQTEFETAARLALIRLRGALADMLNTAPDDASNEGVGRSKADRASGGRVRRAVDIERTLNVDRTTSWRLHKIASAGDPLSVGIHVPGPTSMQRVLKQAAGRSVPADKIEAVRVAYEGVDEIITRYAGDRATFDSIVSGFADDEANQVDLAHRRLAFRGQSHIWGMQARVRMATYIFIPNARDPSLIDGAMIHGYYDLRWLRTGASLTMTSIAVANDKGQDVTAVIEQLGDNTSKIGLLEQFSDNPPPPMRLYERQDGIVSFEILGNQIGLPASTTCLFGHIARGSKPIYKTELDTHLRPMIVNKLPAESLVFNVLLHKGTFGQLPASSFLLSELNRMGVPTADAESRRLYELPMKERVAYVGTGINALHTSELPGYSDLLAWVTDHIHIDAQDFHAYHFRAEYPPTPASVVVEFPLLERPS